MKELHKAAMTANMAMLTDGNGHPSASDKITKLELNMLNGVTKNIQTQINTLNTSVTSLNNIISSQQLTTNQEFNRRDTVLDACVGGSNDYSIADGKSSSFYRMYESGWVEMGGVAVLTPSSDSKTSDSDGYLHTISFPKTLIGQPYTIQYTMFEDGVHENSGIEKHYLAAHSSSSMTIAYYPGTSFPTSNRGCSWYVCGYMEP